MRREMIIRMVAGTLTLIGLALGVWVHQYYLFIPAFVGANLLQSSLTKWCLVEDLLKKFEIGQA